MKRPRIALLNRCYWPDAEATGQLLEQLCAWLKPQWDVTVVAGQPNTNVKGLSFLRSGRQTHQGVTIDRLPHTTFSKKSTIGRLMNLLSFTWQVRRWGKRQMQPAAFDMIVSETDPFFLPMVAAPIARRMKAKFVVYVQDIYPDIAVGLGVVKEGFISGQIRKRLLAAYHQADRIIVLDIDMRDRLIGWGLPADKFAIVPNWVDTAAIHPMKTDNAFRTKHGFEDRFVVMHSGNMGLSQRLETLIDATCLPNWPASAVLALVGDGARKDALIQYAQEQQAAHVRFIEYQPREHLSQSLSAADLHVVSMDANIKGCLAPSKLYGILATGTPVMAITPDDFAIAREIQTHRVGCTVTSNDAKRIPEQIAEHVAWCIDHPQELEIMGLNALKLVHDKYEQESCCRQVSDVLQAVCGNSANADKPSPALQVPAGSA